MKFYALMWWCCSQKESYPCAIGGKRDDECTSFHLWESKKEIESRWLRHCEHTFDTTHGHWWIYEVEV